MENKDNHNKLYSQYYNEYIQQQQQQQQNTFGYNNEQNNTNTIPINVGGCTYFINQQNASSTITPPSTTNELNNQYYYNPNIKYNKKLSTKLSPYYNNISSNNNNIGFFGNISYSKRRRLNINEDITLSCLKTSTECIMKQMNQDDERYKEIPPQFQCAYPLDLYNDDNNHFKELPYPNKVYKVINKTNGMIYALRRIDKIRTTQSIIDNTKKKWSLLSSHSNIIELHDIFLAHGALFFINEYVPSSESIYTRYCSIDLFSRYRHGMLKDNNAQLLPEYLIWTIFVQILNVLKEIHNSKESCRCLSIKHTLVSVLQTRVKIGCIGVMDILEYDTFKSKKLQDLQREDLFDLGRILLSLACRSPIHQSLHNEAISFIKDSFSKTLVNTITDLICLKDNLEVEALCSRTMPYIMDELTRQSLNSELLENILIREYKNGQLALTLIKLGLINERPELNMDKSWNDTGDRYILKLFRDYIFHQVNDSGKPIIDYGHIIDSLNKFENESDESILLSSRDHRSVLIASFKNIKRCADNSLKELVESSEFEENHNVYYEESNRRNEQHKRRYNKRNKSSQKKNYQSYNAYNYR